MLAQIGARLRARIVGTLEVGRRAAAAAAAAVARSSVSIVGLLGFAAFLEGVRRVYVPAAFMLGGALLVTWAVLKSSRAGR